jgi:antitoxin VapB
MGVMTLRTASIFKNGNNQAIRLPKDFEFEGVTEVIISKDGDSIVLTPKRKSWVSFANSDKADDDFMKERGDIIEEGRVEL